MENSFRLGGNQYSLTRTQLEQAMKGVRPKPIDKYFVRVAGTAYPPKQVIATALGIPLVSFTTMDAARIVSSLGFEILTADRNIEEFNRILPIDRQTFHTSDGDWEAAVIRWPIPPHNSTVLLYEIEFSGPSSPRRLRLWVPGEIEVERRQSEAMREVQNWLELREGDGEIRACFS